MWWTYPKSTDDFLENVLEAKRFGDVLERRETQYGWHSPENKYCNFTNVRCGLILAVSVQVIPPPKFNLCLNVSAVKAEGVADLCTCEILKIKPL